MAAKKEEASQEAEELRSITEQVANKSAQLHAGHCQKMSLYMLLLMLREMLKRLLCLTG